MSTIVGKKQLAFVEKLGKRGVGIGPGVNQADAEDLVSCMNSGTTTRNDECAVLWMGEHLALVYFIAGGYSDNGGRHYCPAHINLCERNPKQSYNRRGQEVHDCTTKPGKYETERLASGALWGLGRVTPAIIQSYIARAKVEDAKVPAKQKANAEYEKKARAEEQAKEAAEKAKREEFGQKRARMLKLAELLAKRDPDPTGDAAAELGRLVIETVFAPRE